MKLVLHYLSYNITSVVQTRDNKMNQIYIHWIDVIREYAGLLIHSVYGIKHRHIMCTKNRYNWLKRQSNPSWHD